MNIGFFVSPSDYKLLDIICYKECTDIFCETVKYTES